MKPKTVNGWGRRGFCNYWRWISQGNAGRKKVSVELRRLIRRMSSENPLWGAAKIRDALVILGFVIAGASGYLYFAVTERDL